MGPKNFGFSTNSTLNGEYLLKEMWHSQLGKGFGNYEGSKLSKNFGCQQIFILLFVFLRWLKDLMANIFGMKHDVDNRPSALQTTRSLLYRSKRHEVWSANSFKFDLSFYPPSVNSAFHFIARLRRRRSANWIQSNVAKRWMVNRANNLPYKIWGHPTRKNLGPENFYICSFFDDVEM